jgi:hypothetical protein
LLPAFFPLFLLKILSFGLLTLLICGIFYSASSQRLSFPIKSH